MGDAAENNEKNWFRYFRYQRGRDSPSDARNVLLVVAALIAAVTFQAGVNPPGGVWQDNSPKNDPDPHTAGRAIYASDGTAFYVFLISNTLALSTSMLVIGSLTYRFPFHFEVLVAAVSMAVTYGSAIFAITPHDTYYRYVLLAGALPFIARCLIQMFKKCRIKVKEFMSPPAALAA